MAFAIQFLNRIKLQNSKPYTLEESKKQTKIIIDKNKFYIIILV
jgi:hypothetical protein